MVKKIVKTVGISEVSTTIYGKDVTMEVQFRGFGLKPEELHKLSRDIKELCFKYKLKSLRESINYSKQYYYLGIEGNKNVEELIKEMEKRYGYVKPNKNLPFDIEIEY